ncbi:MAG: hypothetical protein O2931_13810 [Planctomycetota bacterium]|nr:hypothetical protein [Planctomycetota bacterium]MDA1179861.1 hypothetical protein [Planctomycetota bacterium]
MNDGQQQSTVNPYVPLGHAVDRQTKYVKLQLSQLAARELARLMLPNVPAFLFVLAARCLRQPVCTQYGHAPLEWIPTEVDDFHSLAAQSLRVRQTELGNFGFQPIFSYRVPGVGNWEGCGCVWTDDACRRWITWSWMRTGERTRSFLTVGTWLQDKTLLVTTDASRGIESPPHIKTRFHSRRPLATLLASHQNWLSPLPPAAFLDWQSHELVDLLNENKRRCYDYYRARSIWVPMSQAEVARISSVPVNRTDIT